jgi:hypothetical protein
MQSSDGLLVLELVDIFHDHAVIIEVPQYSYHFCDT